MARKPGRMGKRGEKARIQTDEELSDVEAQLLMSTTIDWESLRPQVEDSQLYDQLIEQVQQATANNENLAQLKSRIEGLGKEGWQLTKKVIGIVSKVT